MPLPPPSHPTVPRRRSKRSFRRRPPVDPVAAPPKAAIFVSDRPSHPNFSSSDANNNRISDVTSSNPGTASTGSFRFRSSKHNNNHANNTKSGSTASFRFQKSFSGKNLAADNININSSMSFSSLRFQSARSSQAKPPPPPATALRHSNASSPSLRFESARKSSAAAPPSFSARRKHHYEHDYDEYEYQKEERTTPQHSHNDTPIYDAPSPTPTTTYTSKFTGSFRFQSANRSTSKSKGMFRFRRSKSSKKILRNKFGNSSTNNNNNINSNNKNGFFDSATAAAVPDACALVNRAVRTARARTGVLKILQEIDSLVHYAQRDAATVDIMARRILGINDNISRNINNSNNNDIQCENYYFDLEGASNVVAQKQLQAASILHALRLNPSGDKDSSASNGNPAVQKAKSIIKSARTLLDSQLDGASSINNTRLLQMERTLYKAANDLVDVDTTVTAREQILELLVLIARKRSDTLLSSSINHLADTPHTPSSNISSSSSNSLHSHRKAHDEEDAIGHHEYGDATNLEHNNNSSDCPEERLEYVLKYQHQFQDWAPITVKESYPNEKKQHHQQQTNINAPKSHLKETTSKGQKKETKRSKKRAPQHEQQHSEMRLEKTGKEEANHLDKVHRKQQPIAVEEKQNIKKAQVSLPRNVSAEARDSACTLIGRTWKTYRLKCCKTIEQMKRLKTIRNSLRAREEEFYRLKCVDALTNEVLILLGEVESREIETLKTLAETYVTALVPLLASTRRRTAAGIITRALNGHRIRKHTLPEMAQHLRRIETCVTAAVARNNSLGYKAALEELRNMASDNNNNTAHSNNINNITQRALKTARLQVMQKLNGTRRIEELRTIARNNEAAARDREAVENKAQDWITWWTDYGVARSDLRLLLATLHRILPGWNNNSNINTLEIEDPIKIRSIYRKALLHVHPDRVAARMKKIQSNNNDNNNLHPFDAVMAQKIFVELQEAYKLFVQKELSPNNCDE